jgi:hypothetical protein
MNAYQKEQFDTYRLVVDYLASRPPPVRKHLLKLTSDYLEFRQRLDAFQQASVGDLCSGKCYQSRISACCSKDSIVVYFADVVVNCLSSSDAEVNGLLSLLQSPNNSNQCVYLSPTGCRWRISPIVCAMFLCDEAEAAIFGSSAKVAQQWRAFEEERKRFTWPDRPVLFDTLEHLFINAGLSSPLMHLNTSPGLLALKRRAGLATPTSGTRRRLKG